MVTAVRWTLKVVLPLLSVAILAGIGSETASAGERGEARKEMVHRHNVKRAKHARVALIKSKPANQHAQKVAERIAKQSGGGCVLVHSSGPKLLGWYNAKAGENIGCIPGCINTKAAMRAFWSSPPHKAIILDHDFRWIGVGVECGGNDLSYFAIHFVA
jgi:uncharacterized protein YkwD